jgi:hypothetical protein
MDNADDPMCQIADRQQPKFGVYGRDGVFVREESTSPAMLTKIRSHTSRVTAAR